MFRLNNARIQRFDQGHATKSLTTSRNMESQTAAKLILEEVCSVW
jgi:hypothetical protein